MCSLMASQQQKDGVANRSVRSDAMENLWYAEYKILCHKKPIEIGTVSSVHRAGYMLNTEITH